MKCVCVHVSVLDCFSLALLQILCIYICVCVCVSCSCVHHLLCHLSKWTDCLTSQHQMAPACVRHWRIKPYISYNNTFTHTHASTLPVNSLTDHRFMSFVSHTCIILGFHTCLMCLNTRGYSMLVYSVCEKREWGVVFVWVDLPEDCSVLHRPCLPITLSHSLIWRLHFPL